jgi:hypothetical protein
MPGIGVGPSAPASVAMTMAWSCAPWFVPWVAARQREREREREKDGNDRIRMWTMQRSGSRETLAPGSATVTVRRSAHVSDVLHEALPN